MKQRIFTAVAILAIVLPPLILGGMALDFLIFAFAAVAVYEVLHVCLKRNSLILYGMSLALCLLIAYLPSEFLVVSLVVLFLIYSSIPVFDEKITFENASYFLAMFLLIIFTIQAIKSVYSYSNLVMLYILVVTYVTDTGAYFVGRFLGKHKLNERISPKKTIEGSIGGFVFGASLSYIFALFFLSDILPMDFMLIYSILAAVFGQLGDLVFSAVKRHFNVKDFGNIFPGHGGVLDRIDSLVFNLLIFTVCLTVVQLF